MICGNCSAGEHIECELAFVSRDNELVFCECECLTRKPDKD